MSYMTKEAIKYWKERGYPDARNLEAQAIAELAQEGYDVLDEEAKLVGRIHDKVMAILERAGIDAKATDEPVGPDVIAVLEALNKGEVQ